MSRRRRPALGGYCTDSSFLILVSQQVHRRGDLALEKFVSFESQSTRVGDLFLQKMRTDLDNGGTNRGE